MKILIVGTDRKLFESGSEVKKRFKSYATLFDEIFIIIYTPQGFKKKDIISNVHLYPTNSWSRWLYVFDAYRIGRRIKNVDVVSAQDPFECGLVSWFIIKQLKAKLQLQIHTDFLSPFFIRESFLNKIRINIARFLLPRADCIRVVSERIRKSLIAQIKIKESCIVTLPIYVDLEQNPKLVVGNMREKYAFASHIILMASRFTREKNILMGIQAMRKLVKHDPKALLILIGDGPEKEKLQKFIREFGLQKNVIIEQWVSDLGPYYAIADIFMLTSHYEGYGRTAVEAALQNVPVVMTDVGIAIGSVVPIGNVPILAERIVKILKSKIERDGILVQQRKFLSMLPSRKEYEHRFRDQFKICL